MNLNNDDFEIVAANELDSDDFLSMRINDYVLHETAEACVSRDEAILIIRHFKEVFKLEQ